MGGSLIGASGTGKSSSMSAISLLYDDPVIIHNFYEGMEFRHTQIIVMLVRCPPGGYKRSLCLAILDKFDELLGTTYRHEYSRSRRGEASADQMMLDIARLMHVHSVGLLIIDEIQNLSLAE